MTVATHPAPTLVSDENVHLELSNFLRSEAKYTWCNAGPYGRHVKAEQKEQGKEKQGYPIPMEKIVAKYGNDKRMQ